MPLRDGFQTRCKMKILNIHKRFGNKLIFTGESFHFENGKVTYILGESGIGKTTLLRIIAGLDKEFDGDIQNASERISYVFQEPRLFPNLTVKENIEISSNDSPYTTMEILKILELENEAQALPSSLSGGMKMRVAIARAIFNNGELFLMDEPFSALDEELKARILPKIFEILKGKTVIIISHNQEEANNYSDNIINFNTSLNHK